MDSNLVQKYEKIPEQITMPPIVARCYWNITHQPLIPILNKTSLTGKSVTKAKKRRTFESVIQQIFFTPCIIFIAAPMGIGAFFISKKFHSASNSLNDYRKVYSLRIFPKNQPTCDPI